MLSEEQFPFLAEKGHVVSLVGGGGKTTLLYQLSAHCARKGWRVLAATTTHIRQPDHNMAHTEAECGALWAAGEARDRMALPPHLEMIILSSM